MFHKKCVKSNEVTEISSELCVNDLILDRIEISKVVKSISRNCQFRLKTTIRNS